jgi:hypothetical protein
MTIADYVWMFLFAIVLIVLPACFMVRRHTNTVEKSHHIH